MKRRDGLTLLAASLGLPALAQEGAFRPQAGRDYQRLHQPLARPVQGKLEVVEFFWYGCPHCLALEGAIQAWAKTLPAHVSFRQVAVPIRGHSVAHQRLFFVLQALGVEAQFRPAIFKALHAQGLALGKPAEMIQLLQPLGLDPVQFERTWAAFDPKSFSAAQIRAADQLADAYGMDAVPLLGVGGLYTTAPSRFERAPAGEANRLALQTVDFLIQNFGKA
ncbi:thiol:disulfide interchange protein DsbA [Inhella inkyongensis]|uniref:Thiol:disulfide interchange protein n=1 Tax=Inhella inkyongensis TaxID=392593 RepID=A0A840RZF0_9BURK|nr:thiol:disulfide interchange protein DsbA/DsbL [Inhella inkyongensis]MBB5202933.1 thiol:disulfide interchange protein DsbA [Inhella inkyongensis]